MSTDLRVTLPNRPGTLKTSVDSLTAAGVTVEGICGDLRPGDRWGYLHILVDDADKARSVLEGAGVEVSGEHQVEVVEVEGSETIADAVNRFSSDGRNLEVVYTTLDGRLALGTEDMRQDRVGVKMTDARY